MGGVGHAGGRVDACRYSCALVGGGKGVHRMVCTVNQVAWIRWVRGVNWVGGLIFNKVYQLHRRCQLSTDVWYLSDRLFVYSSIPYSSIRPFFYLSVCPHAPGLLLPPVSCDLTKHPQVQGRADPMLLPASDSAPRSRCGPGTLPPPPWLCVCYYVLLLALPLHSHATLVMHLR